MEGALRASEPHLAAMYAMFARLNKGEPVGAESLPRGRMNLARRTPAMYAVVLVPVMFAAIVVGALLSGTARGATSCGSGHSAARGAPWVSRASCPVSKGTTQLKASGAAPRDGTTAGGRALTRTAYASCAAVIPGGRTAGEGAVSRPPALGPVPARSPGAC
jgi:hypothetical protein